MARTKKDPNQTKAGNYLLRSTRAAELRRLMALVHAERIGIEKTNSTVTKADGSWAGYATWGTKMLEAHGLIEKAPGIRYGRRWYKLTTAGHKALDGALVALGERIDTAALLAEIDARRIY